MSAGMVVRRTRYPQVDPRAAGLMQPAVVTVPVRVTVGDAARLARRRAARLVAVRLREGWAAATPETLQHGCRLGLGDAPIAVLLWDAPVVPPGAAEVTVRRRLGPGRPFVLVGRPDAPAGAVFAEPGARATLPLSLAERLARLPPDLLGLLREAGTAGDARGMPVALVGGVVRDLLLGRPARPVDLDLVVEGDAGAIARALAAPRGGRVLEHPVFRTATVEFPGGGRLDVATARRERYRSPGALPDVEPAPLAEDLGRRDFSLNALAVRLSAAAWGTLVDPVGGLEDLRARRIRILHPLSFVEDPTRILRAARFAARLSCRLDAGTRRLARAAAALDRYGALSGDRLREELERLLAEPRYAAALREATRLGAWDLLGARLARPATACRHAVAALALARRTALAPASATGLLLLALARGREAADRWAARLALPPTQREAIRRARDRGPAMLTRLRAAPDAAGAYAILREVPELCAAWARLLARDRAARRYLDAHLRRWRHLRPLASGDDLAALGVPAGPAVGALLQGLLAAQAAGRVRDRGAALRWLRRAARGMPAPSAHPTG